MYHSALSRPASDIDVLRTASLLLGEHGEDAIAEAARMTTHFARTGDVKKSQYWRRVMKSLGDFHRAERRQR